MAHDKLKTIIANAIPVAVLAAYMGSCFWMVNNEERVGRFLEGKIQTLRIAYTKCEPTLKTIQSAYETAAMCSFGVWDPNYEPYKPNKNSTE